MNDHREPIRVAVTGMSALLESSEPEPDESLRELSGRDRSAVRSVRDDVLRLLFLTFVLRELIKRLECAFQCGTTVSQRREVLQDPLGRIQRAGDQTRRE